MVTGMDDFIKRLKDDYSEKIKYPRFLQGFPLTQYGPPEEISLENIKSLFDFVNGEYDNYFTTPVWDMDLYRTLLKIRPVAIVDFGTFPSGRWHIRRDLDYRMRYYLRTVSYTHLDVYKRQD